MAEVLALQSISKSYGRTQALSRVSITVEAGQVYGILGPNGSGKTTMLAIALGAVAASSGQLRWFGEPPAGRLRRRIGALIEQPAFYPWLSGLANLQVMAAIKKAPASAVEAPLRRVGLWDARNHLYQSYSLGMKQRLGLAATLIGQPQLLVLDEPTNGVDAQGIYEIRALIAEFAQQGGTVILASHILDEVEKVCSHVAILKSGQVVKSGPIQTAFASQSWIEVGATDLSALARHLHHIEAEAKILVRGEILEIHAGRLSPAEINRELVAHGIIVNHLVKRLPSLESQYLQAVEN